MTCLIETRNKATQKKGRFDMAFNSIERTRSRPARVLFALLLVCACLPASIMADSKLVTLKFCVTDESGNGVANARIFGSSAPGGNPFKIVKNPSGGCYTEQIKIDAGKTYTFKVEANELAQKEPGVTIAGQDIISNPNITVTMVKPTVKEEKSVDKADQQDNEQGEKKDAPPESHKPSKVASMLSFIADNWLKGLLCLLAVSILVLAWRAGYRASVYRLGKNTPTIRNEVEWVISSALNPISQSIKAVKTQQETIIQQQQLMLEGLQYVKARNVVPQEAGQPRQLPTGTQIIAAAGRQEDAVIKINHAPKPALQEIAQSAYRKLARGTIHVLPEPIYLNAEANSSPMDMLGASKVYLEEVYNKQGTFVLFKDADGKGCVFPNPKLKFRQQALIPLFPALTESQFGNDKENIQPVFAIRVDVNRWEVEPAQ
jgi:hypothetical protein